MSTQAFDQIMVFVFFVYGLSFFGMGFTLALESERSPALVEARLLRPLAIFGLIHGTHEWLESYYKQSQIGGLPIPDWIPWLELGILIASYLCLLIYGIKSLRKYPFRPRWQFFGAVGILAFFCTGILVSAFLTYMGEAVLWVKLLSGLTRYLLGVPGALLTALALRAQAMRSWPGDQRRLRQYLSFAAAGFFVYGLSHVFVSKLDMIPANVINTDSFKDVTGFPIQIVRAIAAIIVTISMLRATQVAEKQRQRQVLEMQQARVDALENLQTETKKRETMRRDLLRHIVQAQEEERSRIARELHDETSQTLAAFSLDLASLQMTAPDKPEAKRLINRLQDLSRQMSQGLYRLVHDLRPAQLDDLGLVSALQYLADQDARSKELEVRLDVQGPVRRLDPIVETVLFRVTQEALTNVIRHSRTKSACVCLAYQTREVTLTISDSGVGFDPAQTFSPPHGWGLTGMRERVEAVGGQLNIHSAPGKGALIEVIVEVFDIIP
jgi:signal transduction histidine kinase